jgi:hypothetical protein
MIGKGLKRAPCLLGDHKVKPLNMKQPYPNLLSGEKITLSERDRLIKKYAGRCGFFGGSAFAFMSAHLLTASSFTRNRTKPTQRAGSVWVVGNTLPPADRFR